MQSELSFLREGAWAPLRTDSYEQDCQTGREYANELLETIGETGNPAIFGTVVRAISVGGTYGGIEAGFCSRIGIFIVVNQGGE